MNKKHPLSWRYAEFAIDTGLSISQIEKAVAEKRLNVVYEKSVPLIKIAEGERFIDSLPSTSSRRAS